MKNLLVIICVGSILGIGVFVANRINAGDK